MKPSVHGLLAHEEKTLDEVHICWSLVACLPCQSRRYRFTTAHFTTIPDSWLWIDQVIIIVLTQEVPDNDFASLTHHVRCTEIEVNRTICLSQWIRFNTLTHTHYFFQEVKIHCISVFLHLTSVQSESKSHCFPLSSVFKKLLLKN